MFFSKRVRVFLFLIVAFHLCFRSSYQQLSHWDAGVDESLQPLSEIFHNSYFLVMKSRRLRDGKILKSLKLYNNMACVHQCTRMADSCTSVNFKKQATNGLYSCELMTGNTYEEPGALVHDEQFDHIALQRLIYSNCADIYKTNGRNNGVYRIAPVPSHPIQAYCDMVTSGGGWTVIQKRIDGSDDFYRNWADYKRGFGNKFGEYWLGLDNIHTMTSQRSYRLRVDLEDFEGNTRYAEYDSFIVADEAYNYRLTVGPYSGTAGDSLGYHNGMPFSTKDRDNDEHRVNCAVKYPSGWWFQGSCGHRCNPNGLYLNGTGSPPGEGVTWNTWLNKFYSLKRVKLKIRPTNYA